MSYILDALRKADAQRERDPARGIHAQSAASASPALESAWKRPGVVAAAAALLVVAIGAALWPRDRTAGVVAAPGPVAMPSPVAPGALPSPPVQMSSTTSAMAPATAPATAVFPAPVPVARAPVPPRPAPAPSMAPVPAAGAGRAAPPDRVPATAASGPAGPAVAMAPAAASAVAPERILPLVEGPPEVQRLPISGGVYSENAAQRMLIVGGQVVGEGAEIAPGIVLEQIRPKSAVVRVRGLRVAVPY